MRILIVGLPGSGKTSLARKISQQLKIPHIEADSLYWRTGSAESLASFRNDVRRAVLEESWIFEGHFSKIQDIVLPLATNAIVMETKSYRSFYRMVFRELKAIAKGPKRHSRFRKLSSNISHWPRLRRSFTGAKASVRLLGLRQPLFNILSPLSVE